MTDTDYDCPTCEQSFSTRQGLGQHHAAAHGEKLRVTLTCEWCGDEYEVIPAREKESRFCSRSCRGSKIPRESQTNRVTLSCEHCGEDYEAIPAREKESRFCSASCRSTQVARQQPTERVTLTCERCGDEYETIPAKAEQSRFCSWECTKKRITLVCEWCGDKYETIACREETSRFCSKDCLVAWRSEEYEGDGNHRWEGGRSPYGSGWTAKKRRRVRVRDQARCQHCGRTEPDHLAEFGTKHAVHHITPAREVDDPEIRNSMDNLITLCRGDCHSLWEQVAPLRPETEATAD